MTVNPDLRPGASHTGRGRGIDPQPAAAMMGGIRFGILTFREELPSVPIERVDGRRFVRMGLFDCDCGGEHSADLRNVKRGFTRSCGCLVRNLPPVVDGPPPRPTPAPGGGESVAA